MIPSLGIAVRPVLVFAGFLSLAFVVFYPAMDAYFVSDDFLLTAQARDEGFAALHPGGGRFLRPVITASFLSDFALWGLEPRGYHAVNITLHAVNAFLVSLVAAHVLAPMALPFGAAIASALGAGLLFLLLPCHSESVCWISGRTDVIATFFLLVSLSAYCGALALRRRWRWTVTLAAFALGLLAKETAIAFPFVMALVAYLHAVRPKPAPSPDRRSSATSFLYALKNALPFFVILAGYLLLRRAAIGTFVGGYGARGHLRFGKSLLADCLSRFAWRSLFPPLPEGVCETLAPHARVLWAIAGITMLALLAALAYAARRTPRAEPLLLAYLCFWAALLPVCNVRIQLASTVGERFLYFPTVFVAIGVAGAFGAFAARRRYLLLAAAPVLVFFAVTLWRASADWRTAGDTARTIARDIAANATHETVYLVNRPDRYRGAYVFRSGLEIAVANFSEKHVARRIQSVFVQDLRAPEAQVSLSIDRRSGNYTLSVLDDDSKCFFANAAAAELLEEKPKRATFRFREKPDAADVFCFTRGRALRFLGVQ